jgi:hypothetical protein
MADSTFPAAWGVCVRARPHIPALAFAAVAAVGIVFFAVETWHAALTPDFPWLLRTGQIILADGSIPGSDPFSWTAADKPLVLYQWLFMVLLAIPGSISGNPALFVAHVGLAAAIYLLGPLYGAVPRRVSAAFTVTVGVFVLAIVTVNVTLRPMVASSAMLLAQYALVQKLRGGRLSLPSAVCLVASIYAAWANLHNGFVLGLGSLALFAVGDLIERGGLYRFEPGAPDCEGRPLALRCYATLGIVAAAASLANPYGIGLYAHLAAFSSQPYLNDVIQELRSPDFHIAQFRWFLLLMAGVAVLMMRVRRVFGATDLLHLAAFTLATLACARIVVWAALFYGLILPRALHHAAASWPTMRPDLRSMLFDTGTAIRRAVGLAAVGAVAGLGVWLAVSTAPLGDPCTAITPALVANDALAPAGERVFMGPETGSCAIQRASGLKVFIDTRFDFYGEEITADAVQTLRLQPHWKDTLRRWQIDRLIVEKRWPLAQALSVDPDFEILYEDGAAVIARPIQ